MTLPVLENGPWVFSVNHDCSESSALNSKRHALWQVKESLVSFDAWSVVASCDSSSVKNIGDGSPDLWTTWANVVFGSGANSWVILENSVTSEQILIHCKTTTVERFDLYYSATGAFNTDGTTTDSPTYTEGFWLAGASNLNAIGSSSINGIVVHAMTSADSKCTRFYLHQRYGTLSGGYLAVFEELVNTPPAWIGETHRLVRQLNPSTGLSATNTEKSPKLYNWDSTYMLAYVKNATSEEWNYCYLSAECYNMNNGANGHPISESNTYMDWAGGYPVSPVGVFKPSADWGGGRGRLQDFYLAPSDHDTYNTYDATGVRSWIKIGGFLLPWNGTQPLEVP